MYFKNKKKGLTLIEMLAVIVIIAILFVLLIPQISSSVDKARETGVLTDFRDFQTSVSAYFMQKGSNDFSFDEMNTYLDKNLKITSNKTIEKSPYGKEYQFYQISDSVIQLSTSKDDGTILGLYVINNSDGIQTATEGFATNDGENIGVMNYQGMDYIEVEKDKVVIVAYKGEGSIVDIPQTIEGKMVIGIGQQAFSKTPNRGKSQGAVVKTLTLPNGLEFINGAAFASNEIGTLVIPSTVKYIGNSAFQTNKITSLTLPMELEVIDKFAFRYNMLTTLNIPKTVKEIGESAFYNNPNLKNVVNKTSIINTELIKVFNSSPTITN